MLQIAVLVAVKFETTVLGFSSQKCQTHFFGKKWSDAMKVETMVDLMKIIG